MPPSAAKIGKKSIHNPYIEFFFYLTAIIYAKAGDLSQLLRPKIAINDDVVVSLQIRDDLFRHKTPCRQDFTDAGCRTKSHLGKNYKK